MVFYVLPTKIRDGKKHIQCSRLIALGELDKSQTLQCSELIIQCSEIIVLGETHTVFWTNHTVFWSSKYRLYNDQDRDSDNIMIRISTKPNILPNWTQIVKNRAHV
jgi:hypothetical protein